jgi:hypothetical protein
MMDIGPGWNITEGARNPWRYQEGSGNAVVEFAMWHAGDWVVGLVDAHRHAEMKGRRWSAVKKKNVKYAVASDGYYERWITKKIYLHRLLHPEYVECDHINGEGLDNRDVNLREGAGGVNKHNVRTESKGVFTDEKRRRHQARWNDANGKCVCVHFLWTRGDEADKIVQRAAAESCVAAGKAAVIEELIARQQQRKKQRIDDELKLVN